MLFSSKGKHRRPSKAAKFAAFAGITTAAIAAPLVGATSASAATAAEWDKVAQCESGGNWSINTGNGYYGGLQFSPSTWAAFGGTQYASNAHLASKSQQIEIAEKVLAGQGKGAWPSCGVGLSKAAYNGGGAEQAPAPKQEQPKPQPKPEQPKQQQKAQPSQERAEAPTTRSERPSAPAKSAPKAGGFEKGDGEYEVQAGDTLSKIAESEQVKGGWQKLFELNKDVVDDADVIYPGQQLHLS
ncbi:transglycosylase family protein [Streptomyces sp. NPDC047315]|uniref:transglycosylase family protein n=1 Tax=Streptomyces sp. NPDC047315 TaxID=3155142 RepID=UPI0033C9AD55